MTTPSTGGDEEAPATTRVGPFTARWDVTRATETTFVTVHVTNTGTHDRSVRVENRLDGPVRPPRRHGVVEQGWDGDGVTRTVPGGQTESFGYACDAPVADPPISIRESREAAESAPVERALRSLDDHAPPRAAVQATADTPTSSEASAPPESSTTPDPTADNADPAPESERTSETTDTPSETRETPSSETGPTDVSEVAVGGHDSRSDTADETPGRTHSTDSRAPVQSTSAADSAVPSAVPLPVSAWFRAVDARLDTVDRLDGPVAEATPVIASLGGCRGVTALATTLDADARALRLVADRASALAARLEATDVPDLEAER